MDVGNEETTRTRQGGKQGNNISWGMNAATTIYRERLEQENLQQQQNSHMNTHTCQSRAETTSAKSSLSGQRIRDDRKKQQATHAFHNDRLGYCAHHPPLPPKSSICGWLWVCGVLLSIPTNLLDHNLCRQHFSFFALLSVVCVVHLPQQASHSTLCFFLYSSLSLLHEHDTCHVASKIMWTMDPCVTEIFAHMALFFCFVLEYGGGQNHH